MPKVQDSLKSMVPSLFKPIISYIFYRKQLFYLNFKGYPLFENLIIQAYLVNAILAIIAFFVLIITEGYVAYCDFCQFFLSLSIKIAQKMSISHYWL